MTSVLEMAAIVNRFGTVTAPKRAGGLVHGVPGVVVGSLTLAAAALAAVGYSGWRRRDLAA